MDKLLENRRTADFFQDALNMLHIIAYDITDPARLKKTANLCKDYGIRIQYSIFQFDLNERLTNMFIKELQEIIDPASDKVMVIPVCRSCRESIRVLGKAETFTAPKFYIF